LGEAEELLQEASRVFSEEGNAPSEALCGIYRAELALRRGASGEASNLLEDAARTFRAERMRLHEGSALLLLAAADLEGERLEASSRRLDEAADALRRVGSPWLHARLSHLRGRVAQAGGTRGRAIRHYRKAVEKIESIRGRIGIDEFRISFVEDKAPIYADLVGAILERGKPDRVADAFSIVERARSRALVDLLAVRLEPAASKADEGSERLLGRLHELRAEINRLSGFERAGGGERSGFRRNASNLAQLRDRESEITEAMRRLERRNAHLGALANGETTSLAETKRALPENTTLIEYFLGRDRSWAFVVNPDEARVAELRVRPEELEKAMLQFRFQIERGNCGDATTRQREQFLLRTVDRHLSALSELIWQPLEIPEGAVIIVPHGALHSLPFAALPLKSGDHVLDRHRLSYLPSASCRRYLRERKFVRRVRDQEPRIVVVEAGDENIPEVRREVEEVRRAFGSGTILRREEATRERFREAAREADIIHIATHGIFRGDDPSFSSLQLADGWMSLYDIYGLALDAELVSLSACQSGRSWVGAGDELVGLTRGFLYAGASALVVTLWPVYDPSTADLMTRFYRRIAEGSAVDEALRRAMQELRSERAHPYYWAPFVSVGGCGLRVRGAA
jgi:CHAT domain-containing protein